MLKIKLFNIIGSLALLIMILYPNLVSAETKSAKAYGYIERYKYLAVEEMHRMGIPASITLAQGMLESAYGESRLARVGKNHFGIKCKSYWKGDTIRITDDRPKECFRKYHSVEESYRDHSNFLYHHPQKRYDQLFKLDRTDYKGWAVGLKKAGYATNPKYAHLLINLIERYALFQFDVVSPQDMILAERVRPANRNFPDVYPQRPNRPVPQYGVNPEVYTRYPAPNQQQPAHLSEHSNAGNISRPVYPWNHSNAQPANSYQPATTYQEVIATPVPQTQVYQAPRVIEQAPVPSTSYTNTSPTYATTTTAHTLTPSPTLMAQAPDGPPAIGKIGVAQYKAIQMDGEAQVQTPTPTPAPESTDKTVKTMKIHSEDSASGKETVKRNKKSRLVFTIAPDENTQRPQTPVANNAGTANPEANLADGEATPTTDQEVQAALVSTAPKNRKRTAANTLPPTLAETEINGRKAVLSNKSMKLDYVAYKYNMSIKKLVNINEFASHLVIPSNTPIFLEAKRGKTAKGINEHVVKEGETLASISQKYGVKLKSLYKINQLYSNAQPIVGQVIYLRKRKS